MRDGGRRVTSIVAVDQMPEGATVIPRAELFRFEPRGMDAFGRITGAWRACGVQPQRIKLRMLAAGVRFDPSWFSGRREGDSYEGILLGALAFGVLWRQRRWRAPPCLLRLRQRAEESDARASDRALYELGKRDAESAKTDVEGPLGRILRDAGIEASPVSWTLCLGTVGAFAAFFRHTGKRPARCDVGRRGWFASLRRCTCCARGRNGASCFSRQFVRLVPQLSASVKSLADP